MPNGYRKGRFSVNDEIEHGVTLKHETAFYLLALLLTSETIFQIPDVSIRPVFFALVRKKGSLLISRAFLSR